VDAPLYATPITLMASHAATGATFAGNLRGCVAEVYAWGRQLNARELAAAAAGFDYVAAKLEYHLLLAVYAMEAGMGTQLVDALGESAAAELLGSGGATAWSGADMPSGGGLRQRSIFASPPPLPPRPSPPPTRPPPPVRLPGRRLRARWGDAESSLGDATSSLG
jgi:hypothetical protein